MKFPALFKNFGHYMFLIDLAVSCDTGNNENGASIQKLDILILNADICFFSPFQVVGTLPLKLRMESMV